MSVIVLDPDPWVKTYTGNGSGSEFLPDPKVGFMPVLFGTEDFRYSDNGIPICNPTSHVTNQNLNKRM